MRSNAWPLVHAAQSETTAPPRVRLQSKLASGSEENAHAGERFGRGLAGEEPIVGVLGATVSST